MDTLGILQISKEKTMDWKNVGLLHTPHRHRGFTARTHYPTTDQMARRRAYPEKELGSVDVVVIFQCHP